jgi:hypothetical protein
MFLKKELFTCFAGDISGKRFKTYQLIKNLMYNLSVLANRARRFLYIHDHVVFFKHVEQKEFAHSIEVIKVTPENVDRILDFQPAKYVQLGKQFLAQGDKGYYAILNGKCVHRSWVVIGPKRIDINRIMSLNLGPNDIAIQYCETAPEARGKNIYPIVLSVISNDFADKNVLIFTNASNVPSIHGIKKAGFGEIGRIKMTGIFLIRVHQQITGEELKKYFA